MKTLVVVSRFLVLFSALVCFVRAADEAADVGQLAGTIAVPNNLQESDVQQAILLAGTGRGWTVKDKADGKVVLFLEQGGWRSQLTLNYTTKEIQIFSNSGKPDKSGVIKKQAVPSWLNFLKQDITKHLGAKAFGK